MKTIDDFISGTLAVAHGYLYGPGLVTESLPRCLVVI